MLVEDISKIQLSCRPPAFRAPCTAAFSAMGWFSGLAWCAVGAGTLGLTLGGLLFVFQDKMLYLPQLPIRDPDDNPNGGFTTCTYIAPCRLGRAYVLKQGLCRMMLPGSVVLRREKIFQSIQSGEQNICLAIVLDLPQQPLIAKLVTARRSNLTSYVVM